MTTASLDRFAPRKTPTQARSTASVDAILEATLQVLVDVGKQRLTTTRVASRAGVSVGTLYQYFPNKAALLQATLTRHLDEVAHALATACQQQHGCPPERMVAAMLTAFLDAKMRTPRTSVALYAVAADLDAARITRQNSVRFNDAIATMLRTAPEPLATPPEVVAGILQGAMVGVARRLLESDAPEQQLPLVRQELIRMGCAYVRASATPGPVSVDPPTTSRGVRSPSRV